MHVVARDEITTVQFQSMPTQNNYAYCLWYNPGLTIAHYAHVCAVEVTDVLVVDLVAIAIRLMRCTRFMPVAFQSVNSKL